MPQKCVDDGQQNNTDNAYQTIDQQAVLHAHAHTSQIAGAVKCADYRCQSGSESQLRENEQIQYIVDE